MWTSSTPRLILSTLLLLSSSHQHLATALKFTTPTAEGRTLDLLFDSITITWATESTDPATGRLVLARTDVTPAQSIIVKEKVELAKEAYTTRRELVLDVEAGGEYRFEMWPVEGTVPLATSFEFTAGGVAGGGGGGGEGSSTSSQTVVSSSRTSTVSSSVSATSSQTTAGATQSQSQSPSPSPTSSQGTGSTSGGLATGVLAGIGCTVPMGAFFFAAIAGLLF